jgi:hypothetical protein
MIVSGKWKIQLNCRDVFITWKCRFLGHGNQVLMNPSKPSVGAGRPLKFEALTRSWSKGGKECRHLQRICKEPRSFRKGHVCMKSRKNTGAPAIDILREAFFSVILSTRSAIICWLAYINPKNQEFQSLSAPYYIHSPWSELGPQNTASSNTHASEMQYWHPNKHRGKKTCT